jgi:hypothetical protein
MFPTTDFIFIERVLSLKKERLFDTCNAHESSSESIRTAKGLGQEGAGGVKWTGYRKSNLYTARLQQHTTHLCYQEFLTFLVKSATCPGWLIVLEIQY